MHQIRDEGIFFVVEFSGEVTENCVIDAIRDGFSQPDYFEKNDVYVFPRELMAVPAHKFEFITQFILDNFKKTIHPKRSAVVAPSGFNNSVVEMWAAMAAPLPYELKIFTSYLAAEEWVSDSGH